MKEVISEESKEVEKIKAESAEIVVTGTAQRPHYQIKYRKLGHSDYTVGYMTSNLNDVFKYLNTYFDIVKPFEASDDDVNDTLITV